MRILLIQLTLCILDFNEKAIKLIKGNIEQFFTDLSLAYSPAIEHMKPFLGTLLGIVGALFLIAVIIVIFVQMRGSSGRDRNNCSSHTRQLDATTTTTTSSTTTTTRNAQLFNEINRESCNDSIDSIEKNPDVIPQENKNDDRDEEETAFEWINTARPRLYATTVVAEQQNSMQPNVNSYDNRVFAVPNDKGTLQLQHHHHHPHFPAQIPAHPNYYATIVPTTSLGYTNKLHSDSVS